MTEPNRDDNSRGPEDDLTPEDTAAENTQPEIDSEIDPELEAEINEALADVEPDANGDGEVTDLEAQLAERTEDLQRVTAEYANYRKRTDRERAAVIELAKAKVVEKFLPVLDDLDLAEQHGDLAEGPLQKFADKFRGIVDAEGLTAFGVEGDPFDPERHEAVQDLSEGDEKVLGTVLRKGYLYGDRLVRTAMVIIADPVNNEENNG